MSTEKQDDRRQHWRFESAIEATVVGRDQPGLPCLIMNYSEGGALLEFTEEKPQSETFHLMVGAKGVDLLCEARRVSGQTIGVKFIGGEISRLADAFEMLRQKSDAAPAPPDADSRQANAGSRLVRRPLSDARDGHATSEARVQEMLAQQEDANAQPLQQVAAMLAKIPEFAEAGFRFAPGRGPNEMALYHRSLRRGFWREQDGKLTWFATGLGAEQQDVASVQAAAYHTMAMVLSILKRQRRTQQTGLNEARPGPSVPAN